MSGVDERSATIIEHRCTAAEARQYGADVVFVAWQPMPGSSAWQHEGVHRDLAAAKQRVGPARVLAGVQL